MNRERFVGSFIALLLAGSVGGAIVFTGVTLAGGVHVGRRVSKAPAGYVDRPISDGQALDGYGLPTSR